MAAPAEMQPADEPGKAPHGRLPAPLPSGPLASGGPNHVPQVRPRVAHGVQGAPQPPRWRGESAEPGRGLHAGPQQRSPELHHLAQPAEQRDEFRAVRGRGDPLRVRRHAPGPTQRGSPNVGAARPQGLPPWQQNLSNTGAQGRDLPGPRQVLPAGPRGVDHEPQDGQGEAGGAAGRICQHVDHGLQGLGRRRAAEGQASCQQREPRRRHRGLSCRARTPSHALWQVCGYAAQRRDVEFPGARAPQNDLDHPRSPLLRRRQPPRRGAHPRTGGRCGDTY
mmetsp:Transcript_107954/g.333482  ORF Transcript_107954/g.333482 Transcript_107954/m.333482 type:complete len:279 (+) Transcript_107954:271-1107(+)